MSDQMDPEPIEPIVVPLPSNYYMGGHGDPVAQFDRKGPILLMLHADGHVTWKAANR